MKNIILFIIGSLTIMWSSCSDSGFLDTNPPTTIPAKEAIKSIKDANQAINGLYNIMQRDTYYNHYFLVYGDIRGTDIQSDVSTQISYHMYTFNHDMPNASGIGSMSGSFWFNPMYLSRNASRIIEAVDNGSIADGSEKEKNEIKGHAIALRAMAHFDQTRFFGYPWAKDQGQSWGAILIDHVVPENKLLVRSTVNDSFKFVAEELERAIPMMSDKKNSKNKLNSYGARALLARTYLYWNKFDKAFETADQLIQDLNSGSPYRLYTHDEYEKAFSYNATGTNFDPESLLELFNTPTDNPGRNGTGYMASPNGYKALMVTAEYKDFIKKKESDVRTKMIGYYNNGAPYLNKYPGPRDQGVFDNNYPLIRVSEVYLIAAEAAIQGKNTEHKAKGLTYLNAISKRSNFSEISAEEYTLDKVLDERRLEFIGEGHRYFDLLRNGKTYIRTGGYHYPAANMEISWDYYKCVLPIPQDQFFVNKNLQQNPEYLVEQ